MSLDYFCRCQAASEAIEYTGFSLVRFVISPPALAWLGATRPQYAVDLAGAQLVSVIYYYINNNTV